MSAIKLNISQSSQLIEQVNTALLDKLYQLASTEGALTNDSDVVGNISVPTTYEDTVTFLRNRFPNLIIAADGLYIRFADNNVKQLLLNAGIGDGIGITVTDAANANIGSTLNGKTNITTFDEFKYFTKNNSNVGYKINNASALTSIDLTNCTYFPSDCLRNNAVLANFDGTTNNPGVLRIADGTVSIGSNSFQYDNSITEIHFPSTLTSLGRTAFADISSLVKLYFESGSVNINISFDRCNAIYEIHVADIVDWCTNMNTDTSIFKSGGHYYEGETEITSLVLPNTVTNIKSRAFQYGVYITSVTFPSSITSIGQSAFDNCTNLVIDDLSLPNLTSIGNSAFKRTKVKHVSNLGHITTIPQECFYGCTQLIDVVIPEGVTTLRYNCFRESSNLTTLTVPSTVTSVSDYFTVGTAMKYIYITDFHAFMNITYGNHAFLQRDANDGHLYVNNIEPVTLLPYGSTVNNTTELTFPLNISIIKARSLRGVSSLVSVTIPNTVVEIGTDAFRYCSNLTNLTFENNSRLTTIGNYAFTYNKLVSVTLPDSVVSIGIEAFAKNSNVQTFVLPDSVIYIDDSTGNPFPSISLLSPIYNSTVFGRLPRNYVGNYTIPSGITRLLRNCCMNSQLCTGITIPNSVTVIGADILSGTSGITSSLIIPDSVIELHAQRSMSITSLIIGNGVTSLENNGLENNGRLQTIEIGTGLASLGKKMFNNDTRLQSLTIKATTPPTCTDATSLNFPDTCTVYVPAGSVDAYKAAPIWSEHASQIQAIP